MLRRTATVLAALVTLGLVVLLLWPQGDLVRRIVLEVYLVGLTDLGVPPSITPEDYAVVLNALAFVLLGWLGVRLLRRSWLLVAGVLVGLSCTVELVQMLPVMQRQPQLLDVVANGLGAVLGAGLASALRQEPGGQEVGDEGRDVVPDGGGRHPGGLGDPVDDVGELTAGQQGGPDERPGPGEDEGRPVGQ